MKEGNRGWSRRALLAGSGIGIGFGVLTDFGRSTVAAQSQGQPAGNVWSAEYWANKGNVSLYLYRKRVGAAETGKGGLPVLVLVHGSSISARPSFDLSVPGHGEYSLMNTFAAHGYDVWTLDHEGYGRSTRTEGNSDIASGVEDLKAAVEVIARETGEQRFHFYGTSSGALRAGAFAMARPERVRRLVLEALTWTGKGSPTLGKRSEQVAFFRTHNRRPRDRDMIRSIFTRDKPGTSDPAVAEALADAELPFGDTIPTGTYLDMTANLPVLDPDRIKAPVLIVRGEYDGIATEEDLLEFFRRLPNADRQFSVLAGASHAVALGLNRHQLWHVASSYLAMPERLDKQPSSA